MAHLAYFWFISIAGCIVGGGRIDSFTYLSLVLTLWPAFAIIAADSKLLLMRFTRRILPTPESNQVFSLIKVLES